MAVSLATAASLANMMLNSGTVYGSGVTDSRYYTAGIPDAALSLAAPFSKLLLGNANHGRRNDFQAIQSNITSPFKVPSHIGPLDPVQFVFTVGKWTGRTLDGRELQRDEGFILDQENLN